MLKSYLAGVCWTLLLVAARTAQADADAGTGPEERWCAPEIEALSETVCAHVPDPERAGAAEHGKTLVIFLHGLVGTSSRWAWDQQRMMLRTAKAHGFAALIPRGRPGFGPGRDPGVLAWPTAQELQEAHEDSVLAEWSAAREQLEARTGAFERVLVFGFSNGAYYATSLALRGRLADVQGYGVFAGGAGGKYARLQAKRAQKRVPVFVGYGTKDPAYRDPRGLVRLLRELGWPHRSKPERIGHTVSDAQLRAALLYLSRNTSAPR